MGLYANRMLIDLVCKVSEQLKGKKERKREEKEKDKSLQNEIDPKLPLSK